MPKTKPARRAAHLPKLVGLRLSTEQYADVMAHNQPYESVATTARRLLALGAATAPLPKPVKRRA
jgi:hypothetical protein